jgi:hypothetical protein
LRLGVRGAIETEADRLGNGRDDELTGANRGERDKKNAIGKRLALLGGRLDG